MPLIVTRCEPDDLSKLDERIWQDSVRDLHRVMETIMRVWLLLEHANEPLVRVALEIVTGRHARQIMSWSESWWPDEDKRNFLKHLVQSQLRSILQYLKPGAVLDDEESDGEDPHLAAAEQRAREWEERFHRSEQARRLLEMRVKEAEERAEGSERKQEELELALQRLRQECQDLHASGSGTENEKDGVITTLKDKITSLEQQLRMMKENEEKAALEFERQLNALRAGSGDTAILQKQLSDTQKQLSDAQHQLRIYEAQVVELQRKISDRDRDLALLQGLPSAQPLGQISKSEHPADDYLRLKLQDALEAAEDAQKRAAELHKRAAELEHALGLAESRLSEAEARAVAAEAKAQSLENKIADFTREGASVLQSNPAESQRGAKDNENERLKALLDKKREENARLREEHVDLETKYLRALEMIKKLNEQLEKLKAVAERKGYGKVVQQLMEESGLAQVLDSGEFAVFNRLYEDALRRQAKYAKWLEANGQTMAYHPYLRKGARDRELSPNAPRQYLSGRAWFSGKYFASEDVEAFDGVHAATTGRCPTCGLRQPPRPVHDEVQQAPFGAAQSGDGSLNVSCSVTEVDMPTVSENASAQIRGTNLPPSFLDGHVSLNRQRPSSGMLSSVTGRQKRPTSSHSSPGLNISCPSPFSDGNARSRGGRPHTAGTPDLKLLPSEQLRSKEGNAFCHVAVVTGCADDTSNTNVCVAGSGINKPSSAKSLSSFTIRPSLGVRPHSGLPRPVRSNSAPMRVTSTGSLAGKRQVARCG